MRLSTDIGRGSLTWFAKDRGYGTSSFLSSPTLQAVGWKYRAMTVAFLCSDGPSVALIAIVGHGNSGLPAKCFRCHSRRGRARRARTAWWHASTRATWSLFPAVTFSSSARAEPFPPAARLRATIENGIVVLLLVAGAEPRRLEGPTPRRAAANSASSQDAADEAPAMRILLTAQQPQHRVCCRVADGAHELQRRTMPKGSTGRVYKLSQAPRSSSAETITACRGG